MIRLLGTYMMKIVVLGQVMFEDSYTLSKRERDSKANLIAKPY